MASSSAPEKFQFSSKTVAWAGFTIGPDSVKPLPKHTEAVRTYPNPVYITDMRSFMALLQQVAYCYAISPRVAKIRHLLKPSKTGSEAVQPEAPHRPAD